MVYYVDYQSIGPNGFDGIEKTGGPNKIHLFFLNDGSTIPNNTAFRIFLCPLENIEIHCIDMQKGYDYLKQQIVCWVINHLTRTEETSAIILTKEGDDYAACKAFAFGMHKSIYTYPSFADVKAEHMISKRRPFPQNAHGTAPRDTPPLHIVQNETAPEPKPEAEKTKEQ